MNLLTQQRAAELLARMRDRRIVVYGDAMLDEFVWGDVTRISPEAPVPVVVVQRESVCLGGAANVLANLVSLGARVTFVGVAGCDRAGEQLAAKLDEVGAHDRARAVLITDTERPTTLKTRILAHNHPVVRADRERRTPVAAPIEDKLIAALTAALKDASALVVSDYDKGAVTPRVLAAILPRAESAGLPVLIDPKPRNFDAYRPATLVTPNHHEALHLANSEENTDAGMAAAARTLRARINCQALVITRGERGMLLLEGDGPPVYVETVAREVYDVTGAGDTVIATLAAALSAGATLTEAAALANHAAGIVVGKLGTATATADEVVKSFIAEA